MTELDVPIFDTYRPSRKVIGMARRGRRLPVRLAKTRTACRADGLDGQWLKTPGGYLCTSEGVVIGGRPAQLSPPHRPIDLSEPLTYRYVKMNRAGVPRYSRPKADPAYVLERQSKAFFLARDTTLLRDGRRWLRTVYREYVDFNATVPVEPTRLRGARLNAHRRLPIAFVIGPEEGVTVRCLENGRLAECGRARKHRAFTPVDRRLFGTEDYVQSSDGRFYPAPYVRHAQAISRPDGIPPHARWVHINLDEQTFVAYEGDVPQYTSLVSSGVEGHDTPDGIYRVQRKYVSKTMRGPDDTHGMYRVEEIPWVMYYHGTFAVHGAYWHNSFGEVRSHGCTNLAPVDAKWLFDWDQSKLPAGWHASFRPRGGLYFYFSKFEERGDIDES